MLVIMTVLVTLGALMSAAFVGYLYGRRAGSARPTWRQRTSRVALGRRAAGLAVLVAARRIERRWLARPLVDLVAPKALAKLGLRTRAYRGTPGW